MTNKEIMDIAMQQSAYDTNAKVSDFLQDTNVFVKSGVGPLARKYYKEPIACNFVSYGSNVVASVKDEFKEIVEIFEKKGYDILVLNTICNATQERQVEARRIASEVDAMIVIGGKHSSNTQKLYEICQKECKNTYFIQSLGDFNPECVNSVRSVGITAGASTPNQIIEEVHTNVRIKF